MVYIILILISAILAVIVTPAATLVARRFDIIDYPGDSRKIHKKPTPLLGGLAPFLSFFILVGAVLIFTNLIGNEIPDKRLLGLFIGGLIIMIGGVLDDKYNLKPSRQFIFPVIAIIIVIASGIGVREITNPLGGTISLVWWEKILFFWNNVPYRLTLPADLITFVWLLGMIYTTKLLDGLDGLVSGLTAIGGVMILLLAVTTKWYQPEVGVLAAILAGSFIGFLFWNFNPAKIFLGTSGSTIAGFILGSLAVISGGKIATTLLVFGIPVLDIIWVISRRVFWEKKSFTNPDRKHLHHRLLEAGFSQRKAVLLLYFIAIIFGSSALILQSRDKLVMLGVLVLFMFFLCVTLVFLNKQKKGSGIIDKIN